MRLTEQPHPLTTQLDRASPNQLLKILLASEMEVFGNQWGSGLSEKDFQNRFTTFQAKVQTVLNNPLGRVFISGAGTSGRLGLAAQISHSHRFPGQIQALLAGGQDAFFEAKEGAEDSAANGFDSLCQNCNSKGPNILIGISCGLSAPFVAGSLKYAMDHSFDAIAVLGFNPIADANPKILEELGSSFKELLFVLSQNSSFFLLNPLLGPEPITGSTRLKGGTATKIFLDILFTDSPVAETLSTYSSLLAAVDENDHVLEKSVINAAESLVNNGSICYFSLESKAMMALLDASECPPTFGSIPNQVRAYFGDTIYRKFKMFSPKNFLLENFTRAKKTPHDFLISLDDPKTLVPYLGTDFEKTCFYLDIPESAKDKILSAPANIQESMQNSLVKRQLNALSTAAFVLAGKVWGNRMIDLRISNTKLYHRAIDIIANVTQAPPDDAKKALDTVISLVRSEMPIVGSPIRDSSVAKIDKVIPISIVFLKTGWPLEKIQYRLSLQPKIRDILEELIMDNSC